MPDSLFKEGHKAYIRPGQKVAPGTKLYHGPHGGVYYIPGEEVSQQPTNLTPVTDQPNLPTPQEENKNPKLVPLKPEEKVPPGTPLYHDGQGGILKPTVEDQISQWQADFKSLGQAHQTLESEFKKEYDLRCEKGWMDYCETKDEKGAIGDWVGIGHTEINAVLRHDPYYDTLGSDIINSLTKEIDQLDQVLTRATAHQDYTIFRGVSGNTWEKITTLYKEGKLDTLHSFEDKGFTSWTYDYKVSKSFTPEAEVGKLGLICRTSIRKGDHGLVLAGGEAEILLPRGKSWRLKSYTTQKIEGGDYLVLDLEEEGNDARQ